MHKIHDTHFISLTYHTLAQTWQSILHITYLWLTNITKLTPFNLHLTHLHKVHKTPFQLYMTPRHRLHKTTPFKLRITHIKILHKRNSFHLYITHMHNHHKTNSISFTYDSQTQTSQNFTYISHTFSNFTKLTALYFHFKHMHKIHNTP